MIGAALAGGLVDRTLATTLISAVALSMLLNSGAGEARRSHRFGAASGRGRSAAGDPAGKRGAPRHHRRLRPRRGADRRHAGSAQDSVHRLGLGRAPGGACEDRRQAGLLRRRRATGIPAPLRPRDGARRRRHHGFARRQRSGGRDDAPPAAGRDAGAPARDADHARRALSAWRDGRGRPRRSRRASSSPRRCWSISACRWVWVIASIHEKRDEFRKILAAAGAPARPRSGRTERRGVYIAAVPRTATWW